ncbi:hypothetical protein DID88_003942 [Monilinia fructigena]|uniref:Glutathione S-transferase n=1 Tax=Monilinia fructigena TaxID=38457 RepID=A0A395IDZ0_9HELO|nr:hypothetical protein DID88_003942 [Monilinia fructigena]
MVIRQPFSRSSRKLMERIIFIQAINISEENIQKEPWFTEIYPNGRIPAIVDHDRNDFAVFEGAAILSYLTRHYDPEHRFSFTDSDDISRAEQWIAWQHGGLGPMQGQANHFYRLAKERIPYPTQRYIGESESLYGILDTQLKDHDYPIGAGKGKYSIADIASFSWVNALYFAGVDLSQSPHLEKWWGELMRDLLFKKGIAIPNASKLVNVNFRRRLEEEPEFKEAEDKLMELGGRAKEQYGYKFASP